MGVTRSAISVRFHGEDVGGVSGVGELTWGQQGIWETIQRTGRTLNIGGALPMPAGTTAEEIATFAKQRGGMTQGWTGSFDKLEALVAAS